MQKTLSLIAVAAAFAFSPAAFAESPPARVAHYQGKQAEGLAEAVANLREANAKLAELLGGEVGEYDIHDIHSLSYTLEESLAKMRKELEHLQGEVESMHFYSEGLDREEVIQYGNVYLQGIAPLLPPQ
ncbi:MAG: hypothetical protein LPJ91_04225 [Pseudazoarcus pumilus]|nr:hypothetical protein [Pseudazoarcus pumilus]